MILSARIPGRQMTGPHREHHEYSLTTTIDPFLEDMLRTRIVDNEHATMYLFSATPDGQRQVVWEEWRLASKKHGKTLDSRIILRSIALIAGALPPLPKDCHFSIDECPLNVIPIDQYIDKSDYEEDLESFSTIQIAGEGGSVRFRRNMHHNAITKGVHHDHVHNNHIVNQLELPIQETKVVGPNSFESVKLEQPPMAQVGDDDTADLTTFLRRLEGRPSLPGLYSDSWLMDFGEDGWGAIVKAYDNLQSSIASNHYGDVDDDGGGGGANAQPILPM